MIISTDQARRVLLDYERRLHRHGGWRDPNLPVLAVFAGPDIARAAQRPAAELRIDVSGVSHRSLDHSRWAQVFGVAQAAECTAVDVDACRDRVPAAVRMRFVVGVTTSGHLMAITRQKGQDPFIAEYAPGESCEGPGGFVRQTGELLRSWLLVTRRFGVAPAAMDWVALERGWVDEESADGLAR